MKKIFFLSIFLAVGSAQAQNNIHIDCNFMPNLKDSAHKVGAIFEINIQAKSIVMNGYNTILGGKNTTQWQITDASETIIKAQSIGQSNQSRLTIDRYKGTVEIQPDGYKGNCAQITKKF